MGSYVDDPPVDFGLAILDVFIEAGPLYLLVLTRSTDAFVVFSLGRFACLLVVGGESKVDTWRQVVSMQCE